MNFELCIYKNKPATILNLGKDLTKINQDGREFHVRTVDIKEKRPTREERYDAIVSDIRVSPSAYFAAGWIATHDSNIHVSTPPATFDITVDELAEQRVEFDETVLTVSTDATQGRSYSVVTDNHGHSESLYGETGVVSTLYHGGPKKLSIQAKAYVLNFLLGDLRFKLGKSQDVNSIRCNVPSIFLTAFDLGTKG